ncbi:mitochondrial rRNA methyltransferase 2 isoform X2 [Oratosquilla oratoria]|uniref:mitochondrial rRNA methyltransferase 2 isoform X2 n=1 Tax=Oratosquilla oratoria TaxID=337810 RepID=UPI003F75F403
MTLKIAPMGWQTQRMISTSTVLRKNSKPFNLKGKSGSSYDWLKRQLKDPYVTLAKYQQYRARSAFKLQQLDDRCGLLGPGKVVVECGAAPGAWTQVAVRRVNSDGKDEDKPNGFVVGIDLLPIHPLEGATFLCGLDFTTEKAQEQVIKADVVLSDMAPNASGVGELDHDVIIDLCYASLRFSVLHSREGAHFVCKLWQGPKDQKLLEDVKKFYNSAKFVKPDASRGDSAETFIVGKGFAGLAGMER